MFFSLSGCSNFTRNEKNERENDKVVLEDTVIEAENKLYKETVSQIETVSLEKIDDILKDEKNRTIIYFGRITCPFCRKFIIENKEVINANRKKLLYVDTEKLNQEGKKKLNSLEIDEVPTLIQIKDNKLFRKVKIEDFERAVDYE